MGIPALFEARGGINIGISIISGDGSPGGGRSDQAVVGSLYADLANGHVYTKKTSGSGGDKWVRTQNQDDLDAALLGLSWREPAKLRDGTLYADLVAAEAVVNLNPYEVDGVVVVEGDRILFDTITGSNKNVYYVTGTPGSGATLVEDGNDASKGDAIMIQDGTVAGRKYAYNGTSWVQQGAEERTEMGYMRSFIGKTGEGSETPDYLSNHTVTDGDTLEKAIGDLDAEVGAEVATSQSRTKGSIADQAVNLNIEALDDAIGADVTSTHQVIAADSVNENITALDASLGADVSGIESRTVGAISIQSVNLNIESLDDAIGSDVTSTKVVLAANSVNANISLLDNRLGDAKAETKAEAVTASTTLDSVLVDSVVVVEWTVHARSTVSSVNNWAGKILAIHNGTTVGDATIVDYNTFAGLKTGSAIPSLDFDVDLEGVGAAQSMRLRASSGQSVDICITRAILNQQ